MKTTNEKFIRALETHQTAFGLAMSQENLTGLAEYYELVERWNPRLHLVATRAPEEFALRHALESLFLLQFLPRNSEFADVGTGAGLPSIPCLLVREDLRAVLVESNVKKAVFLRETAIKFDLQSRVRIENSRFEQLPKPEIKFVACRALDKFSEKLPELVRWAETTKKLLFFGGEKIRGALARLGLKSNEFLIPFSENRFLFIVERTDG